MKPVFIVLELIKLSILKGDDFEMRVLHQKVRPQRNSTWNPLWDYR